MWKTDLSLSSLQNNEMNKQYIVLQIKFCCCLKIIFGHELTEIFIWNRKLFYSDFLYSCCNCCLLCCHNQMELQHCVTMTILKKRKYFCLEQNCFQKENALENVDYQIIKLTPELLWSGCKVNQYLFGYGRNKCVGG